MRSSRNSVPGEQDTGHGQRRGYWDWTTRHPLVRFSFGVMLRRARRPAREHRKPACKVLGVTNGIGPVARDQRLRAFQEPDRASLSGIPQPRHDSGNLACHESRYAGLLYMSLRITPVDLRVKEISSHGRSDMVILTRGQVFVLEFKMADNVADMEPAMDGPWRRFGNATMRASTGAGESRSIWWDCPSAGRN